MARIDLVEIWSERREVVARLPRRRERSGERGRRGGSGGTHHVGRPTNDMAVRAVDRVRTSTACALVFVMTSSSDRERKGGRGRLTGC